MHNYIAGFHAVRETLKNKNGLSGTLLVSGNNPKYKSLIKQAEKIKITVRNASLDELNKICSRKAHRGVILFIEKEQKSIKKPHPDLKTFLSTVNKNTSIVLLLDSIMDPGNFGAILRSADLFEVDAVIVPASNSVKITQTVRQASAGASTYVNVITVSNLNNAVKLLKEHEYWIYGADMNGVTVYKEDLNRRVGLIMGSEGKGLKPLLSKSCDSIISIPQQGHIDSFNVSVAAGILLYEIKRQQIKKN